MNRNVESHFALNPTSVDISRSKFDRTHSVKTSFNVGDIIPFYLDEILPGDTFNVKTNKVIRMQTLKTPIMDNIYLDTYYFFVPNRLVWNHWKEFNGENSQGPWAPAVQYQIPLISAPSGGWNIGTIADYFGIPTGVSGFTVNALPFRAYALIMSEWFRDENLSDPLNIPLNDTTVTGVNTGTFVTDVAKGGLPYKAAKYHDYFTSALPAPQKGPDVPLPLGNIPVIGQTKKITYDSSDAGVDSVNFQDSFGDPITGAHGMYINNGHQSSTSVTTSNTLYEIYPNNLWAIPALADPMTINQLRLAFQIQKLYEKDARGGTRYIEIIKSHFGVTSPDARLQRPEYLGGNRCPINITQITQNSESSTTPQGTVTGMSQTVDRNIDFTKSFTEHGYIIGVMVARYDHSYQQGLDRLWRRRDRFDFYWPVFANIGEQAIRNSEIYLSGNQTIDDQVFGYQEAWADYRFAKNLCTGMMRSSANTSLDSWHLADDYASLPSLSDSWIREDKTNVDRVLAINSNIADQLFADIYVQATATRPMPVYSVPGLIDHH